MEVSLQGRSAIVTGGSKGLGLAIARQFIASGANVMIAARGREALDQAVKSLAGESAASQGGNVRGRVAAAAGDVAKAVDVQRIYDDAMKAFGKIDIVVNNAGVSRAGAF